MSPVQNRHGSRKSKMLILAIIRFVVFFVLAAVCCTIGFTW